VTKLGYLYYIRDRKSQCEIIGLQKLGKPMLRTFNNFSAIEDGKQYICAVSEIFTILYYRF
jgi:hypothetical protein